MDYSTYVGQLIELRQNVFIDDEWQAFRVTGWLAKVVEQEGESLLYLDDKSDYVVEDGGQLVRDSKVSTLTNLMRYRKPAWEVNPGGWEKLGSMWEPKPTEPKASKAKCSECSRADCPVVLGTRGAKADVVVVGEAPGASEFDEGEFWVGRAGQLLKEVEKQTGMTNYIIGHNNACLCYKDNPPTPTAEQIEACRDRLIVDLVASQPKVIMPTGNVALQALMIEGSITQRQGLLFDYHLKDNGTSVLHCKVIPAFHPAAVLRRPHLFPELARALSKVVMYLEGQPLLDIQPKHFKTLEVRPGNVIATLKELASYKGLTVDLETTGLNPYVDLILCVSMAGDDGGRPKVGYTFKWEMFETDDSLFDALKELLESRSIKYFNGLFDCQFFRSWGIEAKVGEDVMLKYYTTDERPFLQGLKPMARAFCNAPNWEAPLKQYLPSKSTPFSAVPYEVLALYAALDSCYTGTLDALLNTMMDDDAKAVYSRILVPVSNMFLDTAREGLKIDLDSIEQVRDLFSRKCNQLREGLVKIAWEGFNPNSPIQCKKLFHEQLKLTNADEGTGRPIMERVGTSEALMLIDYRSTYKMLNTYIDGIRDEAVDGRLHPNLRLNGTVTGRLASGGRRGEAE